MSFVSLDQLFSSSVLQFAYLSNCSLAFDGLHIMAEDAIALQILGNIENILKT